MGKEDLIVDNPLLLTSLFQKGFFVVPEPSERKKTLEIAPLDVIHLVVETGESSYREVVIPNTMNALTKIQAKWGRTYDIVDVATLGIPVKIFLEQVPNQVKVVFWGKESEHAEGLMEQPHRLLLLNMPSVMLASQENKTAHWNQIKMFFGV